MKFAINIPNFGKYHNPREVADIAVEAEHAGWDGFFLWDHMAFMEGMDTPVLDPWITLAAIAVKTEKIKLGPLITPIPRRRPWKLARETVSLDHLSKGRLILGIGLGAPEYDFVTFGESFNSTVRAKKLDEGLEILLGLWSGKDFSYQGEYYQLGKVKFLPTPVNGTIPIWVAGMWPNKKPFIRAAQYDGVCPISIKWPNQLTPKDIKEIRDFIHHIRPNLDNYDFIIMGDTTGDKSKDLGLVKSYEEVGATWWCENINAYRFSGSTEKMIERIRMGPPKDS